MTIVIDKGKAIELLERAVAEKGADYIYPRPVDPVTQVTMGCVYARDGKPSCLVGHVLFYVKPDLDMLTVLDRWGAFDDEMPSRLPEYDIEVTEQAQILLYEAQQNQDIGKPWGEALRYTKALMDETMSEPEKEA